MAAYSGRIGRRIAEGSDEDRENRWMVGRSDGRTDGQPDGRMDKRSDGRTERRSDGQTVGWTDGRMVGQSDGQTVGRSDGFIPCGVYPAYSAWEHIWCFGMCWGFLGFANIFLWN